MEFQYPGVLEISYSEETYEIKLLKGTYILEAYGASGGGDLSYYTSAKDSTGSCIYIDSDIKTNFQGNATCNPKYSQPGAGGYVRGKLLLRRDTTIFVHTGGQGQYGKGSTTKGGHNGGGDAHSHGTYPAGSGGGATDFRVLNDSLFNRFLVAGAGGGSDNADNNQADDGSGGSGGLPGQGLWTAGVYKQEYQTTTTYGYSFGYGQSTTPDTFECAGAGSGFFGGFALSDGNSGASGGSSFALTEDADIPTEKITVLDSSGAQVDEGYYALTDHREYYLTDVVFATGVWTGHGKARITFIESFCKSTCDHTRSKARLIIGSLLFTFLHAQFSK